MAIKFFEPESTTVGFEPVPFLSEYVKTNEVNPDTVYQVIKVIESPKGYLVLTEHFSEFYFKSSKVYNHLAEAFKAWSSKSGKNLKKFLCGVVVHNGHDKPNFRLGIDTEFDTEWVVSTTSTGKKCYEVKLPQSLETNSAQSMNPLLVNG